MRSVTGLELLIDVPFYAGEAGVRFSSLREAGDHFLSLGQFEGHSPSPFILWAWIKAHHPEFADFQDFVADPMRACVHPAIAAGFYGELYRSHHGDVGAVITALSRLVIVEHAPLGPAPLVPRFAVAARALGFGSLPPFLATLSRLKSGEGALEMDLFSSAWYHDVYDDVVAADLNAFRHYVVFGWKDGRDPSPAFSTRRYLDNNPDVARLRTDPLLHFLNAGEAEGRKPTPSVETSALVRHATKQNTLPRQYVPFVSDDLAIIQAFCAEIADVKLVVTVPFFKNEHLVDTLCESLLACEEELLEHGAGLLFVNDSPGYTPPLDEALERWATRLSDARVPVVLFASPHNRGFIHSSNVGLSFAEHLSCPCLLLNSDTELTPGSLSEMLRVAALDDRFGFVNPLSNNATLATFTLDNTTHAAQAAREHATLKHVLPPVVIVPTGVGFCLLVRPEIIRMFGYLDPAYGHGYHEENDYIMRANRKGYLAVLAPRAFVAHVGEQSFSLTPSRKTARDEINRALLELRYPEFAPAVSLYFASAEAQARRIVEGYARALDFVIDVSELPGTVNGTSTLAVNLVARLVRLLGPHRCAVRGDESVVARLGLANVAGLLLWRPEGAEFAKVAVRLSQPFTTSGLSTMAGQAAKIVVFMLDTISDDCLYLKSDSVHELWDWVARFSDGIVYNSPYTMAKFNTRFAVSPHILQTPSYHSLDVSEYMTPRSRQAKAQSASEKMFILLFGNHYQHKALNLALEALTEVNIAKFVVGLDIDQPNTLGYDSGRFAKDDIDLLLIKAAVVVFPSLYEGFGFPLMESLAHEKPIIVAENELNIDLLNRLGNPPHVFLYRSFADLRQKVLTALTSRRPLPAVIPQTRDGWARSAIEITLTLEQVLKVAPRCYERIARRQKELERLPVAV